MAPPKGDNWIRRFTVSDARRHKKGFTIYKVTSIVFPRASPEAVTKVVVWKRYNDFKKLHQELKMKHQKLYLQDKFPTFAKAKFFGRFEEDVIEERRKCAVTLLEFIGDHPPLFTSSIFVKFFETGYSVEDEIREPQHQTVQQTIPIAAAGSSKILEPIVLHNEPTNNKNNTALPDNQDNMEMRLETEGPLLKLGGTWEHRQQADSISLSSQSSDEGTFFTDTDSTSALSGSGISTPLQSSDLQFFDPLQQTPSKEPSPSSKEEVDKKTLSSQVSNSWLLSLSAKSPEERKSQTEVDLLTSSEAAKPKEKAESPIKPSCSQQEHFSSSQIDYQEPAAYIVEAANHVGQAQLHESKGDYEAAFAFYKTGIACLLNGVQGDADIKRKQLVREKTARYLLQAEKIYSQHLATKSTELSLWDPKSCMQLQRPLTELQFYKVLGVIDTIMLVLNTIEDRCYVMKVLHKSPCPINNLKHSLVPQDVPYMVKLHRYFETDSAVFLVLQHASGGKLWDHVGSYFQSLPPTPVHELTMGNVYLGKKLIQEEIKELKSDAEAKSVKLGKEEPPVFEDTDSSQDHSYLELIRDYTENASKKKLGHGDDISVNSNVNTASVVECEKQDYFSNLSAVESCGDEVSNKNVELNLSKEQLINKDDSSLRLPDNIQTSSQECKTNASYNPVPDLLRQDAGHIFSWKNLESLDTTDLVENAQKLLASVNKTLLTSENIASRLKNDKSNQIVKQENDNHKKHTAQTVAANEKGGNDVKSKPMVRCKSEDSPATTNARRRRLSSGRRRSATAHTRTSSERRYSNDDLFEGHGRGITGSLDRAQQLARLQTLIDCPKPRLPEGNIRMWAAEMVVALNALHQWGVICRDLHPDNILLGEKGHLLLTYMCQWTDVDFIVSTDAIEMLYAAPEVNGIFELTPAADWWSFGALAFELLTGKSLLSCHPGGIHSHTILNIPEYVSKEAKSLLSELLRHNPQERLGSGVNGIQELKSHPFFNGVNWDEVLASSISA